MDKLKQAINNIIRRIQKGTRRHVKLGRASSRRFMQSVRKRINSMTPKTKLIALCSAAACVIAAVVIIIVCASGNAKNADETAALTAAANTQSVADSELVSVPTPTPTATPEPTPEPTPTPTPDPTLKRGMEREDVSTLQLRLMELGFMADDEPTTKYGPATEAAVTLFQRQVNFTESLGITLAQDGIAGEQTLALIYSDDAPHYVVKYGMEGDDITEMQEQLKDLGYMSAVTGYYGDKTVAALKDFQDRNGLSADGLCGEQTFELLYSNDARESASKAKSERTKANIEKMISVAKEQLGDKYVLGAKGPDKFDCSGLVYYCLKEAGSNRRRLNAAGYSQVSDWTKITDMDDLKRGDLIFFYDNNFTKIGHVGIVMNSSEMIDASNSQGKVVRRDYTTSYWKKHFYCGRRPW